MVELFSLITACRNWSAKTPDSSTAWPFACHILSPLTVASRCGVYTVGVGFCVGFLKIHVHYVPLSVIAKSRSLISHIQRNRSIHSSGPLLSFQLSPIQSSFQTVSRIGASEAHRGGRVMPMRDIILNYSYLQNGFRHNNIARSEMRRGPPGWGREVGYSWSFLESNSLERTRSPDRRTIG